jgi:glycosyltransferase involved in cell wall biosynthesis
VRILFDAYWWVNGPVSNKRVLHALVMTWLTEHPEDKIALAVRASDRATIAKEFEGRIETIGLHLKPHGISVIAELPFAARAWNPDVTLAQNFTPIFGVSAVFIHDVLFLTNPGWFTPKERLYFRLMPLSARRADLILTSTESERKRIERFVRTPARVKSVGLAVNPELSDAGPPHARPVEAASFILTVGRLNVRKNLEFTCRAAVASGRFTPAFPLVIVGAAGGRVPDFDLAVSESVAAGSIVFLGHVTDEDLAWLYQRATAFVFMTLGEGFGLPPLEALTFGTLVVASDIPVMREVLGGHAIFVDPYDQAALAEVLSSVPFTRDSEDENRDERKAYADEKYSWHSTVSQIRSQLVDLTGWNL